MKPEYALELYREKRQWRWRFRAANKYIMAVSSEGYVRREDALHCAAVVTGMPVEAYDRALDAPSARFQFESEDRVIHFVDLNVPSKKKEPTDG